MVWLKRRCAYIGGDYREGRLYWLRKNGETGKGNKEFILSVRADKNEQKEKREMEFQKKDKNEQKEKGKQNIR